MLLHREVGVAFEEDDVFSHVLRGARGGFGVAELQRHRLVHVRTAVDRLALVDKRLRDRHVMRQLRELHIDQVQRLIGDPLVRGGHGRDRIAHIANLLAGERLFVLADRQDAELHRHVIAGQHRQHSGMRARARRINVQEAGVRIGTAQNPPKEHAWQRQVVGELRLAADLGVGVGLGQRLADDGKFLSHRCLSTPPARPPRRSSDTRCSGREPPRGRP